MATQTSSIAVPPEGEKAPHGTTLAKMIYDEVERLLAEDGMSKEQVFALIGEATGRQPRTVGANYYRYARAQGTTSPRAGVAARAAQAEAGDVAASAELLVKRISRMADDITQLQADVQRLHDNAVAQQAAADKLERMRALLG